MAMYGSGSGGYSGSNSMGEYSGGYGQMTGISPSLYGDPIMGDYSVFDPYNFNPSYSQPFSPTTDGNNRGAPMQQSPQAPPPENPLFAQARMQAVNDMMGGGWGQGYQQPQMNPMQMYGGGQQQMQSPFSMFGGPNSGFDWGNYFGTFGGK